MTVATTLSVGDAVLFESALSFLGLCPPTAVELGEHAADQAPETDHVGTAARALFGLIIFLTVVGRNLLGE